MGLIINIKTSQGVTRVTGRLQIASGDTRTQVQGIPSGVLLDTTLPVTSDEQYTEYLQLKTLGMESGGSGFATGYKGLTASWIMTINKVSSTDGEYSIAGDPCVSVVYTNVRGSSPPVPCVRITATGKPCISCYDYMLLQGFVMTIYHWLNNIAHRTLNTPPPTSLLPHGVLPRYEALLARWNHYVWSNSFYVKVSSLRDVLLIQLGYTNSLCINTRVECTCIVSKTSEAIAGSLKFEAMYYQGASSNLKPTGQDNNQAVDLQGPYWQILRDNVAIHNPLNTPITPWSSYVVQTVLPKVQAYEYHVDNFVMCKNNAKAPTVDGYSEQYNVVYITCEWKITPTGGTPLVIRKVIGYYNLLALEYPPTSS